MQIPAGVSRQGSAEKSTDGEQSPGGPSRTCAVIKNNHLHPRKIILWARNHSSPCIQRHPQLMRLDGDGASGALQRFRDAGNAGFFLRERF
jgi:hypothetical protein